jgi:hypothetical protein
VLSLIKSVPGNVSLVQVEADDLADAQPGVEGQQRDHGVASAGAVFDRAQVVQDLAVGQGLGRSAGQRFAAGRRCSETTAGVEVVDRGQGVVDRGRTQPRDGLGQARQSRTAPSRSAGSSSGSPSVSTSRSDAASHVRYPRTGATYLVRGWSGEWRGAQRPLVAGQPQRGRCPDSAKQRWHRPCRSTSRSSMLSAPATIPATKQGSFRWH